jgi:hypothetical protein
MVLRKMFGYKTEKTMEFGENCIVTGFMIRQILLEEDEMGWALTRGGEEKLFIVIYLYVVLNGRRLI